MMAKPMRTLELHYPMIQFLINRYTVYILIMFTVVAMLLCYLCSLVAVSELEKYVILDWEFSKL